MKKEIFLKPSVEVIEFSVEDVITTSKGGTDLGDDEFKPIA